VVIDAPLSVREAGFSLDAATRAGPADEQGREALLKYILRPPLSSERLLPGPDGQVAAAGGAQAAAEPSNRRRYGT
jgi:hypothetical protein